MIAITPKSSIRVNARQFDRGLVKMDLAAIALNRTRWPIPNPPSAIRNPKSEILFSAF
jgi:hypothetical protein